MKSIYIKKISAKNIGPLKNFVKEFTPSSLYVIYGKNETGKTFLVEFIIKTFFSDIKFWDYTREIDGNGKITISGIREEDIEFSLKSRLRKTLDKLLEYKNYPLTPLLAKILIVKGGEVNLDKNSVLSKSLLQMLLLERKIFDEIKAKISGSIKKAKIEDNQLIIDKRGKEGKDFYQLKNDLKRIDELIKKITEKFNFAEIKNLELLIKDLEEEKEKLEKAKRYKAFKIFEEIERIKEKISKFPGIEEIEEMKEKIQSFKRYKKEFEYNKEKLQKWEKEMEMLHEKEKEYKNQLNAKRHLAYRISKEIEELRKELHKFPEDKISDLKINVKNYMGIKDTYKKFKEKEKELKKQIVYLDWIRSLSEDYVKLIEKPLKEPLSKVYIYFSLIFLLLSIVFLFSEIKILSIILILAGILTGGIFIHSLLKSFKEIPRIKEIEEIKRQFKERFDQELRSIVDINLKRQELEKIETELKLLNLEEWETKIGSIEREINKAFRDLAGTDVPEEEWEEKIKELENLRKSLEKQIREKESSLFSLNIPETEYIQNEPCIEFDQSKFEQLKKEIANIEQLGKNISNLEEVQEKLSKEIEETKIEIQNFFKKWLKQDINESEWENKIRELKNIIEENEKRKTNLEGELKGLGIEESDYLKEDPGIIYNEGKYKEIEKQLYQKKEEKGKKEKELYSLKGEVIGLLPLKPDITTPWDEILKKLYEFREEKWKELKGKISEIVANMLVHQMIEKMQKEEEEFLVESINSDNVTNILKRITNDKYQKIKIEGDEVYVSSDIVDYNIRDLSTGAKEQVLLAIRIGIAQKLLGTTAGFLILDDAFQHVDWEKRPLIVDSLIELSKSGWQIFYLTMDDNIKDLFEKRGKSETKVEIISLEEPEISPHVWSNWG